jgi:hypothetical protein
MFQIVIAHKKHEEYLAFMNAAQRRLPCEMAKVRNPGRASANRLVEFEFEFAITDFFRKVQRSCRSADVCARAIVLIAE